MLIAAFIFLITMVLVIWQPKGFGIGTSAVLGAAMAYMFNVVSVDDILEVVSIVWDATLTFIGIILFSMVLDKIGFFEWSALFVAKLAKNSAKKMFIYLILLGAFVSALFANDAAALILTPIILAKMKILKLNLKTITAFLLSGGFISDAASLPFVFSNLTNIITANYYKISFSAYMYDMSFAFIASVITSTLFLWLIFRRDIPKSVNASLLKEPKTAIKSVKLFKFSWIFLIMLLCGYFLGDFLGLPVSLFALGGAIIFLCVAAKSKVVSAKDLLKTAPWQIVWFSIGLYVVVFGLKNAGLLEFVRGILVYFSSFGEFSFVMASGFLSAILSAVMNNLPAIMIMDIVDIFLKSNYF
ncbi:arsenical efflux pump membrane protein ArsB [Campylobacter fetus]|uniref:arsenical efflux pump membrane protein ArsB n=1 Tax=Campylobacter fetus TaxID=196 RepID=UPI0026DF7FD2|nr:arsenical efflux pump membrane protein ArsB [Campylobacter fetus]